MQFFCIISPLGQNPPNSSISLGGKVMSAFEFFAPSLSPPHQVQVQIKGQYVKVRAIRWVMLVCHSLSGADQLPIGILLLSSEFTIQVAHSAGDLFLSPSNDARCPSNLLAGTSLKASRGMAVEAGGLQRVRRGEVAVTLLKEDFPFPSSGQASRKSMSVSWECHLLRIVDHMVFLVQIASHGE